MLGLRPEDQDSGLPTQGQLSSPSFLLVGVLTVPLSQAGTEPLLAHIAPVRPLQEQKSEGPEPQIGKL